MDHRGTRYLAVIAARRWVVWLWLRGVSAMAISQQTGVSLSTVYRWVRRWHEEGSVEARPYRRLYRQAKAKWRDNEVHQVSTKAETSKFEKSLPPTKKETNSVYSRVPTRAPIQLHDLFHRSDWAYYCPQHCFSSDVLFLY